MGRSYITDVQANSQVEGVCFSSRNGLTDFFKTK